MKFFNPFSPHFIKKETHDTGDVSKLDRSPGVCDSICVQFLS